MIGYAFVAVVGLFIVIAACVRLHLAAGELVERIPLDRLGEHRALRGRSGSMQDWSSRAVRRG